MVRHKTHENCGGRLKVIDTRHTGHETYRMHRCECCGKLVYTCEFEVEFDEKMIDLWRRNARCRRKVNEDG